MGDVPSLPLAAGTSNSGLAPQGSERPTALPTGSDRTVTSPCLNSAETVQPQLGRGSAMFSTDLGRRVPRKLQGPPYVPIVVRSDMVLEVITAASLWRSKYPYQYMCIFPQAGWTIGDLWDEEDIHLDTRAFCKEVLRFIECDNAVRAQKYAQDWSKMHPERLPIVGGDMSELYDKSNPLSVVDRIFLEEERREYPPIFLWHVAHIMRTTMLVVKGRELTVKEVASVTERSDMEKRDPVLHSTIEAPATAGVVATLPTAPSTAMNTSTRILGPAASMSSPQPIPALHTDRTSPPTNGHAADPIAGGSYFEPMLHRAPIITGHQTSGSSAVRSALRVPRNRPERSASGTYNQIMPSSQYVENMSRVSSGLGARQHSGPMAMMQPPRYNQAHMATNHPMGSFHPDMVPFAYEQVSTTPGIIAGQPHSQTAMHPNMMPPHTVQSPSMTQGYPQQPSGSQGITYAVPMGDMTNMYYPLGMPPHSIESRRPSNRRSSQQHANGNVLYDPYQGNNPAFRAAGYLSGKKYSHNGLQNHDGRQRKTSHPGSRPYQDQYMSDRPGLVHIGNNHFPGPKPQLENDRAITEDREYGCNVDWIGPQNDTVNELFVKGLPDNVQVAELEIMFHDRLGVKPTSFNLKGTQHVQQSQGWKHAFVAFPTAAIAKQALVIRNPTIRGLPVSITVPRRFFQKAVEVPTRDLIEAGTSSYSRYTSKPNNREYRNRVSSNNEGSENAASTTATNRNLSYSPQDARSDLHNNKKGKQPQQGSSAAGSPEVRKAKPKRRQDSPIKEKKHAEPTQLIAVGAMQQAIKAGDHMPPPDSAPSTLSINEEQTEQPEASEKVSLDTEREFSPTAAEDRRAIDVTSGPVDVPGAADNASSSTVDRQQYTVAKHLESQAQNKAVPHTGITAKQCPADKPMKVEETAGEPAPTTSLTSRDVASDDDLKDEVSFHLAAELQTDLDVKVGPGTGSNTANHTTTFVVPKAVPSTDDILPTTSVSAAKAEPVDTIMPLGNIPVPAAAESKPSTSKLNGVTMPPVESKAINVSKDAKKNTPPFTAAAVVSEPLKKVATQHTESLHPFSKAAKALAKKEKEQKKRAQKKEKEQAEKAKVAKAAASKATVENTTAEDGGIKKVNNTVAKDRNDETMPAVKDESAGTNAILSADKIPSVLIQEVNAASASFKKPESAAIDSKGATDSRDKPGKRKGKIADTSTAKDAATVGNKGEDHGKQTSGAISVPKETDSVTKKEMKVDLPKIVLVPDAQYSKQEDANEALSVAKESIPTVAPAEGSIPSAKKKNNNKKKKKTPLAWPDLKFRPKSPNPQWMGPIDMATDIQHYDEIINEVCGGEEDSDFSWSDLPKVEDEMSSNEDEDGEGPGNGDGGQDFEVINQRIAELETRKAAIQLDLANRAASSSLKSETARASIVNQEEPTHCAIAALETQLAATQEEIQASTMNIAAAEARIAQHMNTHEPSDIATPDSQSGKKKKPNNRKNKKKKKVAEHAEMTKASRSGDTAQATATTGSTSNNTVNDANDSNDPFFDQFQGIEAAKRGVHQAANLRGGHAEAAETCDEPQLMRTMEAYFKETQGPSQSKGRKALKKDLYG